jgi:transcriptional regulator with GAF, ATPase, and Fis domain
LANEAADTSRGLPSSSYTGETFSMEDLPTMLGRIARELDSQPTLDETMRSLLTAAIDAIPGAQAGGITEVHARGQKVDVRYASDDLVVDLDSAQEELGQGPGLDAAYLHRTVRVDDFETEHRWPRFAERARARGAGSMLCLQLYVQGDDLGALNMYSREPRAFDDESEEVGLLFATHAAIAFAGMKREQQFHVGISSRDVIGQAKGILMERFKLTPDQAFTVLTKASSETHLKLRDVAEALTGSGELTQYKSTR